MKSEERRVGKLQLMTKITKTEKTDAQTGLQGGREIEGLTWLSLADFAIAVGAANKRQYVLQWQAKEIMKKSINPKDFKHVELVK
jgi:hypothetical protein